MGEAEPEVASNLSSRIAVPKRIPSLDGFRAISISLVLCAHAAHSFSRGGRLEGVLLPIFGNGSLGVSIFFVISGFLITTLLIREEATTGAISLRQFYIRRAFRILPPFYVYLGVAAVLGIAGWIWLPLIDVAKSGLFVWNYFGEPNWYVGHSWSLSVEEQFYIAWPLLLVLFKPRRAVGLAFALIVLSPVVRVATYYVLPTFRNQMSVMLQTRADMLMFGCIAALLYGDERLESLLVRLERMGVPIAAAIFLFIIDPLIEVRLRGSYRMSVGYTLQGASIALLLLWGIRHPRRGVAKILNTRLVMFYGTLSYSLYLWQQMFLGPLDRIIIKFPLNIICAFGAAIASYFLIERPVLRLRPNAATRTPEPVAPLASVSIESGLEEDTPAGLAVEG